MHEFKHSADRSSPHIEPFTTNHSALLLLLASHDHQLSMIDQSVPITMKTDSSTPKRDHSSRSSRKGPHKHKKKRSKTRSRSRSDRKHGHKRSRDHHQVSSSRRPKHDDEDEWSLHRIDKEKLLEIAQNNLSRIMAASGGLEQQNPPNEVQVREGSSQAKSGSVSDFIKLCKNLQATGQGAEERDEAEAKRIRIKRVFEQIRQFSGDNQTSSSSTSLPNTAEACKIFPVSSGVKHREITLQMDDEAQGQTTVTSDGQPSVGDLSFGDEEIPGKFNRESGGIRLLTPEELEGDYKAWVRKDYLMNAEPIKSAIGMKLMEKMGWRSGQGLGKNKEGPLEPIKIVVKGDRKGLVGPKTTTFSNKAAASVRPQGKNLQL